jgi:diguanylate cyclase (GGDEF)-like protein
VNRAQDLCAFIESKFATGHYPMGVPRPSDAPDHYWSRGQASWVRHILAELAELDPSHLPGEARSQLGEARAALAHARDQFSQPTRVTRDSKLRVRCVAVIYHVLRDNPNAFAAGVATSGLRLPSDNQPAEHMTALRESKHLAPDLEPLLDASRADDQPLAVLYIDLDGFKQVNDQLGHDAGDEVLKSVGTLLLKLTGARGAAYRKGGDELCVLLPNHTADEAAAFGERVRKAIDALDFSHGGAVTASIGAAASPQHATDTVELLKAADRAMYDAKEGGKNRVCVYRASDRNELLLPPGSGPMEAV